jgi:hypothetical protein
VCHVGEAGLLDPEVTQRGRQAQLLEEPATRGLDGLARDLGLALDSGAFLSALRREQVGEYTLADAIQLDDIQTFLQK